MTDPEFDRIMRWLWWLTVLANPMVAYLLGVGIGIWIGYQLPGVLARLWGHS